MADNIGESRTIAATFRFSSGEILALHEDQIERIPYLTALVSSADRFESARDEDGHFKLDPRIDYKHFSFVLKSLSFYSVRQLFTSLPKQNDVIPIIAHLDFLGIGPQPDPTLNEVDSIFFSTVVYSPLSERYLQIVRPSVIQDMAVRFAVAMAKEEYDFTKRQVVDQIYWFIMFILSAHELFGSHLRHHVYKIAEHCFSLFKPSLLKPLKKLKLKTEKNTGKAILTTNEEDVGPDEENKRVLEQVLDLDYHHRSYSISDLRSTRLERRQVLPVPLTYRNHNWSWYWRKPPKRDLLEPVYRRVLEIMYERLQNEICQRAMAELREMKNPYKFAHEPTYVLLCWILLRPIGLPNRIDYLSRRAVLPKRIGDIFKCELVQEEIRERILEEIYVLVPKLEKRRAELVKELQEFEQTQKILHENNLYPFMYFPFGPSRFETVREEALSHELILNKLHQGSNIVEQIHQRVLDALYKVALGQFNQCEDTQAKINLLRHWLSPRQSSEQSFFDALKTMHQHHRIPVNKPLPKRQLKYSTR